MFDVVVVGGGCLAKIGMKYTAHLKHSMPILEDVLAGIAFLVAKDDGVNPILRLDCIGKHDIGAASNQQAIMTSLVVNPLKKIGKKMMEIDRYATEMHNPEITLPAGSGNTPYTNYKMMGALAGPGQGDRPQGHRGFCQGQRNARFFSDPGARSRSRSIPRARPGSHEKRGNGHRPLRGQGKSFPGTDVAAFGWNVFFTGKKPR